MGAGGPMSAGPARPGRRDNGLTAAAYAAVGDVDPRVGEHLLDVLAAAGIAAYLQPSSDLHPITRTTTLPDVPTDRLYADSERLSTAREYLTEVTRGEPTDLDAAWRQIVAGYDAEVPTATWPAAEDLDEPERRDDADRRRGPDTRDDPSGETEKFDSPQARSAGPLVPDRPLLSEPSLLDGLDTFGANLPDTDDEGYTPPPPPPLPRISRYAILGILGIAVGLLLFLWPELLPLSANTTLLLALAAMIAGFITLVWRLRPGDDEDTDPDDGAVV